jgi:polysaccharide pyruvyl transferase WcaK-like protein
MRLRGMKNPAALRLLRARVILDISGGDSFTDLYGEKRFEAVAAPKQVAVEHGIPLILLPQTYGPFDTERSARRAAEIVKYARMAWARDKHSFIVLRELLGDTFNPSRHRSGVDMAFLLEAREPAVALAKGSRPAFWPNSGNQVIGINVSGLIYLDHERARRSYGLRADYRTVVTSLVRAVLETRGAHVVLVPHVVVPEGHYESDVEACRLVREEVGNDRVSVLPARYDQAEVKSIISRCDWFCGTRMHSTIAALSTGVPATVLAYSPKPFGVFESCDLGEHVVDLRALDTRAAIDRLATEFANRKETCTSLATALPGVLARAEKQLDTIAEACAESDACGGVLGAGGN